MFTEIAKNTTGKKSTKIKWNNFFTPGGLLTFALTKKQSHEFT